MRCDANLSPALNLLAKTPDTYRLGSLFVGPTRSPIFLGDRAQVFRVEMESRHDLPVTFAGMLRDVVCYKESQPVFETG